MKKLFIEEQIIGKQAKLVKIKQKFNSNHVPLLLGVTLLSFDILSLIAASIGTHSLIELLQHHQSLANFLDLSSHDSHMNQKLFTIVAFIALPLMAHKDLYSRRVPWWSQIKHITKILGFSLLINGFLSAALKVYEPRLIILLNWTFAYLFIILLRTVVYRYADKFSSWKRPTVVIADCATAEDIVYAFHSDFSTGYNVHKIFLSDAANIEDFDIKNLPKECQNVRVCLGQEGIENYIRDNTQEYYVLALDSLPKEMRESILATCNESQTSYAIVPTISGTSLYHMEPRYFFGNDVMMLEVRQQAGVNNEFSTGKILKRLMDISIASVALICLLPCFGLIAALLKIEGQGGSVFYGGKRIGYNGHLFSCWKFRSMEPDSNHLLEDYLSTSESIRADWEKYRKLARDPRVTTRTARFIRKASIDELPQLWNVLIGDMSLVGPRPILEDETHYFDEKMMKEYLSVRPGVTGLWQVSGRNSTSFKRRVTWDSWYVRNWSLWGDIVILIKTPIVLLTRRGAS